MNRELLILGASSDFASALLQKVQADYDRIYIHYHKWNVHLQEIKEELGDRLYCYQADLSKEADTIRMLEEMEEDQAVPHHIVHFPSKRCSQDRFSKLMWDEYQERIDISLRSLFLTLQKFLPDMAKNKEGKVVVLASAYTVNVPPKFINAYLCEKYALIGMMKGIAAEYAAKDIQINAVSPEMTKTKFLVNLPDFFIEQNEAQLPRKRILSIQEVVPLIEFLLSDGSNGITGENFVITGGR